MKGVPEGWRLASLRELGTFARGRSRHRPRHDPSLFGGRYPFIQTGDVAASGGRITTYTQTYNEAGLAQSRLWPAGTLCITIAANIAETGILTFPACFPDSVVGFVADGVRSDVRFVAYALRNLRRGIRHVASGSGSVQDNINLETLDQLQIPCPSLDEQVRISEVLSSFDAKIELNREMNRTLEALAQTIFRSWFVDFDPVVAKAEGREPFGMDAETAALFPDRFVDSELGPIPEGWEVKPLPEAFEVNPRRILPKGGSAAYLEMSNMPERGAIPEAWTRRPVGSGTKFKNGDTLLARITPCLENGKTAYVTFLEEGEVGWGSTEYVVFRPKPPLPAPFAYFLARSPELRSFAISNLTGSSGRQRVPTSAWTHLAFPWPLSQVASRFGELAEPFLELMLANVLESQTLASLRDLLLPKLLSGEIRVPEAAEMVEDVA